MTASIRLQLRLRWLHGCTECGSKHVRHSMFNQSIMNGKGSDEFVCMDCGHKETASDMGDCEPPNGTMVTE